MKGVAVRVAGQAQLVARRVRLRLSTASMWVLPQAASEREFFIDNLLVRIHLIVEMILVDRPCAMGV